MLLIDFGMTLKQPHLVQNKLIQGFKTYSKLTMLKRQENIVPEAGLS